VKQHLLPVAAVLLCLSLVPSATDAKQNAQTPSQQTTQTQQVGSEAGAPSTQASSAKSDCKGKQKHAK
jgi:hypothetical protein